MSERHTRVTRGRANETIDTLIVLAHNIDPEYSESCAESGMTNRKPETEAELLVSLLHRVALELNALGFADTGEWSGERMVGYLFEHHWSADVGFRRR